MSDDDWTKVRELQFSVPPPEWTCANFNFANFDGCHCDCGAPDPDCDFSSQFVFNCGFDEVCVDGVCLRDIPEGWTCAPESFDTNDGCDCNCGVDDQDCLSFECDDDNSLPFIVVPAISFVVLIVVGIFVAVMRQKQISAAVTAPAQYQLHVQQPPQLQPPPVQANLNATTGNNLDTKEFTSNPVVQSNDGGSPVTNFFGLESGTLPSSNYETSYSTPPTNKPFQIQ